MLNLNNFLPNFTQCYIFSKLEMELTPAELESVYGGCDIPTDCQVPLDPVLEDNKDKYKLKIKKDVVIY